jgi:hypothetical protein
MIEEVPLHGATSQRTPNFEIEKPRKGDQGPCMGRKDDDDDDDQ